MPDPRLLPFKTIDAITLNLHVFDATGPHTGDRPPVCVFFSCGGWRGWNPPKFYPQCEYLASRGMVGISAEVRVASRHGTSPMECVVDGFSAMRWVRRHADRLGIDPDRMVAGGGSAAGHVAACMAIIDDADWADEDRSISPQPNAIVLFNPTVDTVSVQRRVERFGGMAQARALSPAHHIRPGLSPAMVVHGRDDQVVEVEQVIEFEAAMKAAGNRCDLRVYDGEGHGFFNYFDGANPMFTETMRETDRFLASLGYVAGEPTIDGFCYTGPAVRPQGDD